MSYESDAADGLRTATEAAYAACWEAGKQFAQGSAAVTKASDIVDTLARTIDLLVWAEALHDAADAAVREIRATLSRTMEETGATTVQGTHHSAHLARKPAFVSISDEAAIPAEYIVQKPSIDKRAIAAALKDGKAVAGCNLAIPNEMSLVLRARANKEATS